MAPRLARREVAAAGVAAALTAVAVVAVLIGFAPFERRTAWLVVLGVWVLGSAGVVAWLRAGTRDAGLLLAGAAGSALLGAAIPPSLRAPALEGAFLAVAGALFACGFVATVAGRWWRPGLVVALAAAASLVVPPAARPAVLASLPLLALAAARVSGVRVPAWTAVIAAVPLAGAIVPAELMPGAGADPRVVGAFASALAASLLAGILVADADRGRRIVEATLAGEDETDPIRSAGAARRLGALVGDERLRVGFWHPADGAFRDAAGRRLTPPGAASAASPATRAWSTLEVEGQPVALVEHPPGALADPGTRVALTRAAALVVAQAALEAEVTRQADDLTRSRARLIAAADEERRELRAELEAELEPRLAALEACMDASAADPLAQIRAARAEIEAILDGLPPLTLGHDDLAPALRELAARTPVPTEVTAAAASAPDDADARTALYFTCAEGLTNVARHAGATRVRVVLEADPTESRLTVEDDGQGGAEPMAGTGLVGLRDRIDAVGGRLALDSPPGGGTRLVAVVPRTRAPAMAQARHARAVAVA